MVAYRATLACARPPVETLSRAAAFYDIKRRLPSPGPLRSTRRRPCPGRRRRDLLLLVTASYPIARRASGRRRGRPSWRRCLARGSGRSQPNRPSWCSRAGSRRTHLKCSGPWPRAGRPWPPRAFVWAPWRARGLPRGLRSNEKASGAAEAGARARVEMRLGSLALDAARD